MSVLSKVSHTDTIIWQGHCAGFLLSRGTTKVPEQRYTRLALTSSKELAEHTMIVWIRKCRLVVDA